MSFTFRHGDRPLEGFTILRGLGRGGFGEVYYAVSDGGREVALKVIQQNHDVELRGVRHCMNLKSPHLISIFDVKRSESGVPFVIMEYVAGPSLRDILRLAPEGLGPAKSAYLLREIARGLDYLHERGIVHRDLKPENIFYEDGYVKIGDYGLSKYISVSRQSGQTISVGTVHYMAPEIGSGNYHRGIDIYALGVILYELLSGRVPYNGDSMGEIIIKHLTAEPPLEGLDRRFHAAIAKALAKRPDDRYARVQEMVEAIFEDRELAALVEALPPEDVASGVPRPQPVLDAVETVPAASPAEPMPPPRPSAPSAPPPLPRQNPAPRPPQPAPAHAPAPATATPRFFDQSLQPRLVQAFATAAGMALALSFTLDRPGLHLQVVGACLASILAGAASILAIEHWAVPRFQVDVGIARRLLTLAVSGPAIAVSLAILPGLPNWTKASLACLFLGLILIDWRERARPTRPEPASLGQAISAMVCGVVVTTILSGFDFDRFGFNAPLFLGGLMAALSLVVNAASPRLTKKAAEKRKHDAPGGPAAAAVPKPATPASAAVPIGAASIGASSAAAPSAAGAPPPLCVPLSTVFRPVSGRMVAGVCAAIAARFGWEVTWVRFAFVLATLLWGFGPLAYVFFWWAMPEAGSEQARQWIQAARRPTKEERSRMPLARPLQYRAVGGVCAAISARYGVELILVRFVAAILALSGVGVAAYFALWVLIPSAEKAVSLEAWRMPAAPAMSPADHAPAPAQPQVQRRQGPGPIMKAFWFTLSFAAFAFGTGLVIFSLVQYFEDLDRFQPSLRYQSLTPRPDVIVPLYIGIADLAFAGFFFFKGGRRQRLSFLAGTVSPLLLALSLGAAAAAVTSLSLYRLRGPETGIAVVVTAVAGLLAAFLASGIRGATLRARGGMPEAERLRSLAGWSALGTLLVVAALAVAGLGTALAAGMGERLGLPPELPFDAAGAARRGVHLIAALGLYLPGVFCLLIGRRSGGAAHVLRGVIGWAVLGVLGGFIAVLIWQQSLRGLPVHPQELWVRPEGGPRWGELMGVFLWSLVCAVCLAWPKPKRLLGEDSPAEEPGSVNVAAR